MRLRFEFDPDSFDWTSVAVPLRVRQTPENYCRLLRNDPRLAANWARKEAIAGNRRVQVTWGHMLLTGHGTKSDPEAALRWFKHAAYAGDADGANMAGRCYELGLGAPVDMEKAAGWYKIAADAGDPWACFNLACLLLKGEGVAPDLEGAMALLVRSSRQGNPKSMNLIGRCLEEGWRGRVDPAAARRWYLRAARRGCFRGQYHTARFLLGDGDIDGAATWLEKSIRSAPADFCSDIAGLLEGHANPRIRDLVRLAREKATIGISEVSEADECPQPDTDPPSIRSPQIPVSRWRRPWRSWLRRGGRHHPSYQS